MDAMAHTPAGRRHLTVADAARQGMARAFAEDGAARDAVSQRGAQDGAVRDTVSPAGARAGAAELRHRRVRLAREPAAAALARGEVRAAITAWGIDVDTDLAVLLASDLVTNAIVRGEAATITLAVRSTDSRLRVDVYDTWRVLPVVLETGASSAAGPGLALIAAMASEWGTFKIPAGMAVYFALDCEPRERGALGSELPRGTPGITRGDGGL